MSFTRPVQAHNETQFTRGACAVLLLAILLLGMAIFTIVHLYFLPTDGWDFRYDGSVLVLDHNLRSAPSVLRSGDVVTAVNGITIEQLFAVYHPAPSVWSVGGRITYTVLRDGQLESVGVPVAAWTPDALWHSLSDKAGALTSDVGGLVVLAVTLFAFLRRPGNAATRLLLLIGAFTTAGVLTELLPSGVAVQFDALANTLNLLWVQLLGTAFAPIILAFTLVFPHPKMIVQRHHKLAWLPLVWGAVLQAGLVLLQLLFAGASPPNVMVVVLSNSAVWIIMLLTLLLSMASLVHSAFTMRDTLSRAQIRWALGGFGLGISCLLASFIMDTLGFRVDPLLNAIYSILGGLAAPIIGVSLAIAVLRYRLFDIDVIIRRTVVYGLLTALLAGIYFGGVIVLQQVFVAITGQRSELAIILSTLAIAALFGPLRNGIQVVIDRRFFRRKYDAQQALASFAAALRDETHPDRLATQVFDAVDQTMQPERIALWIEKV